MTDKIQNYLLEWIERFLKNRDVMLRRIKETKLLSDHVEVIEKERVINYYYASHLNPFPLGEKTEPIGLVLYNTPDNFKKVLKEFKVLSEYTNLVIYFVNPFSKTEKRWVIFPHTHARIADPQSLELGLKTMFENVEPTTLKEVEQIVH